MTRLPDWKPRLTAWLGATARRPFAEGENDCALFFAGAVEAMTGTDIAARWRGRYCTTKAGLRALRRAGFADHVALAATLFDEVPPAYARIGDCAVVPTAEGPALGIVQGELIYVLGPAGLSRLPRARATRAFRVG
ncbi:MAG: hypothetical protein CVT86_01940 [Alphaproteobacteria bacterium HGW-Alphaproteobacteria-8]|nr:MAG: hypothetical protein CVT86_01940 [Alphaproteobacteria bacterium HGW-Alphaproteobacteria-8]PKP71900.1 MAG: hypothetical protein CVT82_00295 [Alphaproteobacteria bacterium HGW-Alphaproteobacteria-4]